jgi:hypothetical protein
MPERNLTTTDHACLVDAAGGYVVVSDATRTPFVTPNASLTGNARHVLVRPSAATLVARSSEQDVFTRGGTQPPVSPKSPLVGR